VGIYAKDSDNDNIVFLRMDSRRYDYSHGPFDMVFIDGCHALDFVKPDTENSLSHLSPGGVIVWHDYGYGLDVDKYLNSLSLPLEHIEGTRLVFYERGG
jgi:predicted O-methyltransferase YrrM